MVSAEIRWSELFFMRSASVDFGSGVAFVTTTVRIGTDSIHPLINVEPHQVEQGA